MGVKLQSSSGGSVEIAAPVTASNYVLTAPAVTSTVDTLARAGNVLQVVNATYSTQVLSSSSTYADTGLTATITPTSASSKILVLVNQSGVGRTNDSSTRTALRVLRNGVSIVQFEASAGQTNSVVNSYIGSCSTCYLDSAASASAIVYKTQFASVNNSPSAVVQSNAETSTITLMEIAG